MPGKLTGKMAIVTGASAGIGRASALALAAEGAKIIITARRRERPPFGAGLPTCAKRR